MKAETCIADSDRIAILELSGLDDLAIHNGAPRAAEIFDHVATRREANHRMFTRGSGVQNLYFRFLTAPYNRFLFD